MEILLNNPLTNLDSSTFQLVYICLIAALLIIGKLGLRSIDESAARPELPTPRQADPYELAYLRGGVAEAARTAVFSLLERGYLQLRQSHLPSLSQAPHPPALAALSPLETTVFHHFAGPTTDSNLFAANSPLLAQLKADCAPYEEILHKKELLTSQAMQFKVWTNILLLALILALFGGYWGYAALVNQTGGAFMVGLLGLVGIALLIYLCRLPRLSERGRLYWQQLQRTFHELQVQPTDPAFPSVALSPYSNLTVAVSLFGSEVLSGTAYSPFQQMFQDLQAETDPPGGMSRLWQRLVRR